MSDVILLAKSVDTFLPILKPNPDIRPASENPIAESTVEPTAKPLTIPAPTIPFLTIFFNNGFDMLPDTVGLPNVLLCIIPYGLSPSFLYFFSNAKETAPPRLCPITVSIS